MTSKLLIAAGLMVAAVTTGCSAIAGDTQTANDPVRCEISAQNRGGMIQLSGLMHADQDIDGSYRFKVQSAGSGGNTNISQGGQFHAGPNGPTTLGMVMLSADTAYNVVLEADANGERYECEERLGGRI